MPHPSVISANQRRLQCGRAAAGVHNLWAVWVAGRESGSADRGTGGADPGGWAIERMEVVFPDNDGIDVSGTIWLVEREADLQCSNFIMVPQGFPKATRRSSI